MDYRNSSKINNLFARYSVEQLELLPPEEGPSAVKNLDNPRPHPPCVTPGQLQN